MPRDPQTRVIDGHTVQVQALPVFKGQRLFVRLLKTIGGSIGPAFAALASSGSKGLGDIDLAQHLPTMFSALSPEEMESITRELLTGAVLDPHGSHRTFLRSVTSCFRGLC
jgi:hypothetical protein